jgi:hypothetical protein
MLSRGGARETLGNKVQAVEERLPQSELAPIPAIASGQHHPRPDLRHCRNNVCQQIRSTEKHPPEYPPRLGAHAPGLFFPRRYPFRRHALFILQRTGVEVSSCRQLSAVVGSQLPVKRAKPSIRIVHAAAKRRRRLSPLRVLRVLRASHLQAPSRPLAHFHPLRRPHHR